MTTGKRLGWDEKDSVTRLDILDPYDYDDDDLEGELFVIDVEGPTVNKHVSYIINGQMVDPKTIDPDHLMAAISVRKFPLSKVERSVLLDPRGCPECQANTDPNNVPVHPGCKCGVKTESITRAADISNEDVLRLTEVLSNVDSADPGLIREGAELGPMRVRPETVTAIDESFRFGDLLAFVSEHEDQLNTGANVIGVLFDDEDLSEDTETGTSNLVMINDLLEAGTADNAWEPNISRSATPKSVVFPPNASNHELSVGYRLLKEARKDARKS